MSYLRRHHEHKLTRYADLFPVQVVVGARQVGKSTLLKHLFASRAEHHTFDPLIDIGNARKDPEFFLQQHPPPLILDEIQYAPELLPVIKRMVDVDSRPGQYFLTDSQNLALLKNVSESLAGRALVTELGPLTLAELGGLGGTDRKGWIEHLLEFRGKLPELGLFERLPRKDTEDTLFRRVWRGGFPRLLGLGDDTLNDVFSSYFQTYVERDIRILLDVQDQAQFGRFVALCAALTAQEVNRSQLGREIGVSPQTAERWLNTLKATYQWTEVPAYEGNTVKRLVGRGKGYYTDSGFAAWLQRISSPAALSGHPALGSLFETYVVTNILRRLGTLSSVPPAVYHWRTRAGAELDLLLERDGVFWPVEVKSAARITTGDARGIRAFRETYPALQHGPGVILAAVENPELLRDNLLVLPYDLY